MEYKITLDDSLKAIIVETSGIPDICVFKAYSHDIAKLIEKYNYLNFLSNHCDLTPEFFHIGTNEIQEHAYYLKKYSVIIPHLKMATAVNSLVHFGIASMWEEYTDSSDTPIIYKTFKDEMEAACDWLVSSDGNA